jgi:hypothetical protein
MKRRPRLSCLSSLSLSAALCLAQSCAPNTPESGQTGSPTHEPDFETPSRPEPPQRPGGGGVNSPGEGTPDAVPRPSPKPGSTALVGDTLVVAGRGGVTLLDVSTPAAPVVLGRVALEGDAGLLQANTLDRLVVAVNLVPHGSSAEIPAGRVPYGEQQVWQVDASDPAAPVVLHKSDLPSGSLDSVVHASGYTALGALTDVDVNPGCGSGLLAEVGLDIAGPPPPATALWLQKFGPDSAQGERRELAAGHWQVNSAQTHAVRIGLAANETPVASFDVELVDLATLQTTFQITLTPAELGTPLSAVISADYADGLLVLAGGSRLLAFDTNSAQALPPLASQGPIHGLRFLNADELALEGGTPLVRVDRSGNVPALASVPLAAGTPVTGPLMPFGNGYLALDGTGGGSTPALLRATSYALDGSGALALVDQLQTNWYFSTTWRVDSAGERLSYTLSVDDSDAGRAGIIVGNAGALSASDLALTAHVSGPPLLHDNALLAFGGGLLQPVVIEPGAARLSPLAPQTLALEDVWLEVEHAGLIWARHRKDTGESSLSVRSSRFAEPVRLQLPHAVDTVVPLDSSHVAVFGFSVDGMCEYWRETYGDTFAPECGPNPGNGVTVVAADGGTPRIVRSIPLSSFMEGRPPPGIEQGIAWQGYIPVAEGKLGIWGRFQQACTSYETCAQLGVQAHTTQGSPGCSSDQYMQGACPQGPVEFVSGYLRQSWLFVLDVTDPENPALTPPVRAGAQLDDRGNELYQDLGPRLLGYTDASGRVWGYPVDEPVYDDTGNSVPDRHGQSLHNWYLQLVDGRGPRFAERISVPGEVVLLAPGSLAGGSAEHTAFTLEPRYSAGGSASLWLNRVRISNGRAAVDASIDLGPDAREVRGSGNFIAILNGPADFCSADASYSVQALDARNNVLAVSGALALPGEFNWGVLPAQADNGVIAIGGGPAGWGTLSVDLQGDSPAIVEYQY